MASALIVPIASADPEAEPVVDTAEAAPAPPDGAVPDGPPPPVELVESSPPATSKSPDGWTLTVSAKDETQQVIAPLTTAISTREYEVGGLFNAKMEGPGEADPPEGTFEVGYQIGCGISLNVVKLNGSAGITPVLGMGDNNVGVQFPVSAQIEVFPQPGEVTTVQLTQKTFAGANPRVTVKDVHIKVDGCVGQSFLRSYATLTSATADTDDVVAYYGVTKAV